MTVTQFTSRRGLHVTAGGAGETLMMLLHGLGANGVVWNPLIPFVSQQHRFIAPDFRGHGRSVAAGPYGVAMHAADLAELIAEEAPENVVLVGHSFGATIGALLASGWYGLQPSRVIAIGVKIHWTDEETARIQDLATKPARVFATHGEAAERYLKISGLFGLADAHSAEALAGVALADNGFRVAVDNRVYGAVGRPPIETLLRLSAAPLRLAAGAQDPMVTLEQMRALDPAAVAIPDAGHNAHWERPEAVWQYITQCMEDQE
jgi:pimeloyl-ACP methyl ester carboxylesterase